MKNKMYKHEKRIKEEHCEYQLVQKGKGGELRGGWKERRAKILSGVGKCPCLLSVAVI